MEKARTFLLLSLGAIFGVEPMKAQIKPVDDYAIYPDGGLVYNPQYREAQKTGQLARYANVPSQSGKLMLADVILTCNMPKVVRPYDVIPISYTISCLKPKLSAQVAIEATAFEDESRRKNRNLYDLSLPGKLDLKMEYLGSVTANMRTNGRHKIKRELSDIPKDYPAFDTKPLVKSGVVEAGDRVWFKFKFTNTGNTIFDPEGFGGCWWKPELFRKNAQDKYEFIGHPYNLYVRLEDYIYPGEARAFWINFTTKGALETPQNFGLIPGDYRMTLTMQYRDYFDDAPFLNLWEGSTLYSADYSFTVEPKARQIKPSPIEVKITDAGKSDKITHWIHTFEEFMTAFDCYQSIDNETLSGTLYLQVAPWTKNVVVKLITPEVGGITTVSMPVNQDFSSLTITPPSRSLLTVSRNGKSEPAILSQLMTDMRTNIQVGPYPEKHILANIKEMEECGVNLFCTTAMPWLYDDLTTPYIYSQPDKYSNENGDALKYSLDIARKFDLKVATWSLYPFNRRHVVDIYEWLTGKKENYVLSSGMEISYSDPILPKANAAIIGYNKKRWGDLFYTMADGRVPIDIEDTRGWLRQDIQFRYPIGDLSKVAFREWTKSKYGAIEATNKAWGSEYASFVEIDPEADQTPGFEYSNSSLSFHDWSPAMEDLDVFRTELRMKNYREMIVEVSKEMPGAAVCLRTEGGNVIVAGMDSQDTNPRLRHVYYSQRRAGAIAEVVQKDNIIAVHSDYTTMPYSPSELRMLTKKSIEQGIIPAYMPQFNNMRDIALNDRYGTDYTWNLNLPKPKKGTMMHVLTAVYPWFKVVYEEGGAPGILWEDLQCDGFVTVTQKAEMRLFKNNLDKVFTPRLENNEKRLKNQPFPAVPGGKKSYNNDINAK